MPGGVPGGEIVTGRIEPRNRNESSPPKGWFPYDRGSQIAIRSAIVCDHMETYFCDRLRSCDHDRRRSQTIAEDRTMFYLKAGFHMIADRRSQIADRNKVCDRLRSYGNYFCDRLRSCDRDRRRSQKIEPCSISCDRLRSIAIVCDLRSAICDPRSYGNQPLDRTWFYLLRSSAITIAGSQTIADLIAICDHMETSLKGSQ